MEEGEDQEGVVGSDQVAEGGQPGVALPALHLGVAPVGGVGGGSAKSQVWHLWNTSGFSFLKWPKLCSMSCSMFGTMDRFSL